MKRKVLIVYASAVYPERQNFDDHLYCFRRYPHDDEQIVYFNAFFNTLPGWLPAGCLDVIVLHASFLFVAWKDRAKFRRLMDKLQVLEKLAPVKIALPQDEYVNTDLLTECFQRLGVQHVFSTCAAGEWSKIYAGLDFTQVRFHQILSWYFAPDILERIDNIRRQTPSRTIDVGYRASDMPIWLGRHGLMKRRVGEVFQAAAQATSLVTDISTRNQDLLYGLDWYRFMARCKYVLGVESGSSILDRDGSIRACTEAYIQANGAAASFEEIEARCFPNSDGNVEMHLISARHLEACAMRTCQILVEGDYHGILEPFRHYIPLKADFSNLAQVLEWVKQDHLRQQIVENAYTDIVGSGKYTYASLVGSIWQAVAPELAGHPVAAHRIAWICLRLLELKAWIYVRLRAGLINRLGSKRLARLRGLKHKVWH